MKLGITGATGFVGKRLIQAATRSGIEVIAYTRDPSRAVGGCVETRGFSGATCQEAGRFLERALGRTTADERTVEFHQTAVPQSLDLRQAT